MKHWGAEHLGEDYSMRKGGFLDPIDHRDQTGDGDLHRGCRKRRAQAMLFYLSVMLMPVSLMKILLFEQEFVLSYPPPFQLQTLPMQYQCPDSALA